MKRAVLVALAVLSVSCSGGRAEVDGVPTRVLDESGNSSQLIADVKPLTGPHPTYAPAVSAAEQTLALRLLDTVGGTGNVTLSPLSLSIALAVLENGASGTTLQQIQVALGTPSLTPVQQDEGWSSIVSTLLTDAGAGGIDMNAANSVWLERKFRVTGAFLYALQTYFPPDSGRPTSNTDRRQPRRTSTSGWLRRRPGRSRD